MHLKINFDKPQNDGGNKASFNGKTVSIPQYIKDFYYKLFPYMIYVKEKTDLLFKVQGQKINPRLKLGGRLKRSNILHILFLLQDMFVAFCRHNSVTRPAMTQNEHIINDALIIIIKCYILDEMNGHAALRERLIKTYESDSTMFKFSELMPKEDVSGRNFFKKKQQELKDIFIKIIESNFYKIDDTEIIKRDREPMIELKDSYNNNNDTGVTLDHTCFFDLNGWYKKESITEDSFANRKKEFETTTFNESYYSTKAKEYSIESNTRYKGVNDFDYSHLVKYISEKGTDNEKFILFMETKGFFCDPYHKIEDDSEPERGTDVTPQNEIGDIKTTGNTGVVSQGSTQLTQLSSSSLYNTLRTNGTSSDENVFYFPKGSTIVSFNDDKTAYIYSPCDPSEYSTSVPGMPSSGIPPGSENSTSNPSTSNNSKYNDFLSEIKNYQDPSTGENYFICKEIKYNTLNHNGATDENLVKKLFGEMSLVTENQIGIIQYRLLPGCFVPTNITDNSFDNCGNLEELLNTNYPNKTYSEIATDIEVPVLDGNSDSLCSQHNNRSIHTDLWQAVIGNIIAKYVKKDTESALKDQKKYTEINDTFSDGKIEDFLKDKDLTINDVYTNFTATRNRFCGFRGNNIEIEEMREKLIEAFKKLGWVYKAPKNLKIVFDFSNSRNKIYDLLINKKNKKYLKNHYDKDAIVIKNEDRTSILQKINTGEAIPTNQMNKIIIDFGYDNNSTN